MSVMKKIMGKINEFFGEYYKSFGTLPVLCHGDVVNECLACLGRHSTTADQSEIREAYLVSVAGRRIFE